jgi:hypothetical protein
MTNQTESAAEVGELLPNRWSFWPTHYNGYAIVFDRRVVAHIDNRTLAEFVVRSCNLAHIVTRTPPIHPTAEPVNEVGELLPCPFCGGKGKLRTYPRIALHNDYCVKCVSCQAETLTRHNDLAAISAWNTRTPPIHPTAEPVDEMVLGKVGLTCERTQERHTFNSMTDFVMAFLVMKHERDEARARLNTRDDSVRKNLIDALEEMVWQHASHNDYIHDCGLSANEIAFEVLNLRNGMTYEEMQMEITTLREGTPPSARLTQVGEVI